MASTAQLVDLDFGGQAKVTGLPTPVDAGDAANKGYVDAEIAGVGGGSSEVGPAFTYTSGKLSLITYDSGNTKEFTYDGSGRLSQIDYVVGATTTRKTFAYNPDGSLSSITETVI